MFKAAGRTAAGLPLLILGVSGENVTRMAAGEPLRVPASHLAALGLPPMEIGICYGRTEQDIVTSLTEAGLIRPPA